MGIKTAAGRNCTEALQCLQSADDWHFEELEVIVIIPLVGVGICRNPSLAPYSTSLWQDKRSCGHVSDSE
jgi:hypothetical protein